MAMQKPIQKDPFYSCQFGRKDLKQSGVSSLLLVVMKIDCSGPMSGISQVTQVLQIICHTIPNTNQELNSPDLLVAMAVLLHKLVAKRVKCILKHNRARVPTKNCIGKTISKIKKLKIHLKYNHPKFQHCQHCPQIFPFSVIPSFL